VHLTYIIEPALHSACAFSRFKCSCRNTLHKWFALE